MRAGTGCDCGHQRRTLGPLVNQRQGTGVQLIKLSCGKRARIRQRGRFNRALYVRGGFVCTALNVVCKNIIECEITQQCDTRNQCKLRSRQLLMNTSIALRSCKSWLTQAAVGAPLAVTVPPQATGRAWLPVGAVVINKSAAWRSVGGFSGGTKVIQLRKRAQRHQHLKGGTTTSCCQSLQYRG